MSISSNSPDANAIASSSASAETGSKPVNSALHQISRSPLKWAGGKRTVLAHIQSQLPVIRGRFIEPFLGSGVVYLNTEGFSSYLLADANRDLIDLYGFIRADAPSLAALVTALFGQPEDNTAARYYEMRADFNQCLHGTLRRCALFIYLNRFGFNGLCRYNLKGFFNGPYGSAKSVLNPTQAILAMGRTLNSRPAQLMCSDFRSMLALAGKGDTVYADPPYLPLSETASFSAYHTGSFSRTDQSDLARMAREASQRGALVVISNHDTPVARELYYGATLVELQVHRCVAAKSSSRMKVGELLAVFAPAKSIDLSLIQIAA